MRKGESLLTVMIDSFFGVHPWVIRSGLWAKLKPGEVNLYIYLLEQSERFCTRQIRATDAQIEMAVGTASRTLCNARKKLQENGLIRYERGQGNKYAYTICNPKTGQPYPGNPRQPMVVPKRSRSQVTSPGAASSSAVAETQPLAAQPQDQFHPEESLLESHGLPGVFP
jgi:hypothetical protein